MLLLKFINGSYMVASEVADEVVIWINANQFMSYNKLLNLNNMLMLSFFLNAEDQAQQLS